MERDHGEGTVSSQTQRVNDGRSISPSRVRTGSDPFLVTCRVFSFVTALDAILCIAVFDGIFRCYDVAIAIIVVVAETEWGFFIKFWKVLEFSAGRGMLQIFVAVMTRAYPEEYGQRNDLILLRNISSYFLLTCGETRVFWKQPLYLTSEVVVRTAYTLPSPDPTWWEFTGECCALDLSNVLVRRKKSLGSKQLMICRDWSVAEKNLKLC